MRSVKLYTALFCLASVTACQTKDKNIEKDEPKSNSSFTASSFANWYVFPYVFIPKDTANRMISSYVASINTGTDPDVNAFIVDADGLRAYLSNTNIKSVKIMLAHNQTYMNNGGYGVNAGLKASALTVVIAGVSASGDYVFYNDNQVMDNAVPCPHNCPPGSAGTATLP